ncbi:MAG: prephenate dehydratase [Patescibacteria group bacterium]
MKLYSKKPVAFQGEHGAFSEMAVFNLFNKLIKTEPSQSFHDVFDKVKSGKCEYGIVPVENTLGGIVYQVWDLLNEYGLNVVAETKIKIKHCLIVNPDTKITDIKKVYAHYQAALQCNNFLIKHKNWAIENAYDTAGSVKIIKDLPSGEKFETAAIASERAAKIFEMEILKKNIQDSNENYTRFMIISRKPVKVGDKFTSVLSIKHKPGTLLEILKIVNKYKINLTSIHSRPNKNRPFQYNFFLEGIFKNSIDQFTSEIRKKCNTFNIFGIYESNL